jgi:hypothetical protein
VQECRDRDRAYGTSPSQQLVERHLNTGQCRYMTHPLFYTGGYSESSLSCPEANGTPKKPAIFESAKSGFERVLYDQNRRLRQVWMAGLHPGRIWAHLGGHHENCCLCGLIGCVLIVLMY